MLYDVFICHAFEDKAAIATPLAEKLQSKNIEVWYDEFSLTVGDSLRESIDKGLSKARFGIVILSESFFSKNWTKYELNSLVQKEMMGNDKVILPIWHELEHDDVAQHSLALADRFAIKTNIGINQMVNEIKKVVCPKGSAIIIARDILISKGYIPPVITDQWWLGISDKQNLHLDQYSRWLFNITYDNSTPHKCGESLAYLVLQENWSKKSDELEITPLTEPEVVISFIRSTPGLKETCEKNIDTLIYWAPQLTIPGFGFEFEDKFQELYERSVKKYSRRDFDETEGFRYCAPELCLRHSEVGKYEPKKIYRQVFKQKYPFISSSYYDDADHLFWLLSSSSNWMPNKIKNSLIKRFEQADSWASWELTEQGRQEWDSIGSFCDELCSREKFNWSEKIQDDILNRIKLSKTILNFKDSAEEILEKFYLHLPKYAKTIPTQPQKTQTNKTNLNQIRA